MCFLLGLAIVGLCYYDFLLCVDGVEVCFHLRSLPNGVHYPDIFVCVDFFFIYMEVDPPRIKRSASCLLQTTTLARVLGDRVLG